MIIEPVAPNQTIDQCKSTNDLAKSFAEQGCPHGTWISARSQEAGRGRLGRKWESLDGNLFLSLVVRVKDKALWSWVPLTSAVAIVKCLSEQFPNLDLRIKWPNDILLGGAKLGGILCEGSGGSSDSFIVVGVGLNCQQSPDAMDRPVSDLTRAREGLITTADEIRPLILASLLAQIQLLTEQGPQEIKKMYDQWAFFKFEDLVTWGEEGYLAQSGSILGLGKSAELFVRSESGSTVPLYAEDVRHSLKFSR